MGGADSGEASLQAKQKIAADDEECSESGADDRDEPQLPEAVQFC